MKELLIHPLLISFTFAIILFGITCIKHKIQDIIESRRMWKAFDKRIEKADREYKEIILNSFKEALSNFFKDH